MYYNGKLNYKNNKNKTTTLFFKILKYEKNSKIIECISVDDKKYIFYFDELFKATVYNIRLS